MKFLTHLAGKSFTAIKLINLKNLLATEDAIYTLLSKELVHWVVLATLIAWPIAYIAMERRLQNFTKRVDQSFLVFLLTAFMAFVIMTATQTPIGVVNVSPSFLWLNNS